MTAGERPRVGVLGERRERLVEGRGPAVVERRWTLRVHLYLLAWSIARHTRSGVSGMSRCRMPSGASASMTAFTTAGADAIVPVSPAPFTPSGLTSVGVSVRSSSRGGNHSAFGTAY